MWKLFLFWLLRACALVFSIVNLVYIDVKGFSSYLYILLGIIVCLNLYAWGIFTRETGRKAPTIFILFRLLQGLLAFVFEAMEMRYWLVHIMLDGLFYAILLYDGKYTFVLRKPIDQSRVKVRKE